MDDNTACSNCACPLNYDCDKFQLFFEGKYLFVEEYHPKQDNSCEYKKEEGDDEITHSNKQKGLF